MSFWDIFKRERADGRVRAHTDDENETAQIKRLQNSIRKQRIQYLKEKLQRIKDLQEEQQLKEQVDDLEDDMAAAEEENDDQEDQSTQAANLLSGSPEDALMSLLINAVMKNQSPGAAGAPTLSQPTLYSAPAAPEKKIWTDDELRALKARVPAQYLDAARKMKDDELLEMARIRYPDVFNQASDDSIARAIRILRE